MARTRFFRFGCEVRWDIEKEEGVEMKVKIFAGVVLGLVLTVSHAYADKLDYPAYVGGAGGYTHYDTGISTTGSLDENDWGWKLFGGYRFHENFALEAFYADFGEAELDLVTGDTIEGLAPAVGFDAALGIQSFGSSAVLLLPVSDEFDLFGKVGAHHWDGHGDIRGGGITVNQDGEGTDAFFGVGASFAPTENVSIRLEHERFLIGGSDDVQFTSLAVELHF